MSDSKENKPIPISVAAVERNKAQVEALATRITCDVEELMRVAHATVLNIFIFDSTTNKPTHKIMMEKLPPEEPTP